MNSNTRNTLILVGVLAVLSFGYFFFWQKSGDGTLDPEETNFAITDTSKIQEISLSKVVKDQVVSRITLQRDENQWKINDKFPALQARINMLLETLHLLEIREPLNKDTRKSTLDLFKHHHIQVDIEIDDDDDRHFLVGDPTPDKQGTYFLMKGAENPYSVYIPGVNGYLTTRFNSEAETWRDNIIFNNKPTDIKRLTLKKKDDSNFSFTISRKSKKADWKIDETFSPVKSKVTDYINYFKEPVRGESFAWKFFPTHFDSLRQLAPDYTLSVETWKGLKRTVVIYNRPENTSNYFGWIVGVNELLTIQTYTMNKFLIPKEYFLNN